ncbi:lysylphosphatidylglycerol synthase domain-containing protein, partial [Nostocoides japonicum]|uniref:lysylphosphatidylglycerol synthase domain-containing protein n=1 Tax=Nostocoides japonicum TaxID=99481 RepID=UPI00065C0C60
MSPRRSLWAWLRAAAGLAILVVVLSRLGRGSVVSGVRALDPVTVLLATGLTACSTLCVAWRWRLVSSGLGLSLPLPAALAGCYRAQFLNTVLPGGVLGDVERGVRHGRGEGDLRRGLLGVVGDRGVGQLVQVVLAVVLLSLLPSPVRPLLPRLLLPLGVLAVVAAALAV